MSKTFREIEPNDIIYVCDIVDHKLDIYRVIKIEKSNNNISFKVSLGNDSSTTIMLSESESNNTRIKSSGHNSGQYYIISDYKDLEKIATDMKNFSDVILKSKPRTDKIDKFLKQN